jgi:hypothetical protein
MKLNQSETRNLILYFIIAYSFTWLFWILEALTMREMLGTSFLVDFLLGPHNPAAWGPFVAAFSLTFLNEGLEGMMRLLKRAWNTRFARAQPSVSRGFFFHLLKPVLVVCITSFSFSLFLY